MKKVIASAGLLALGAVGVHDARADWAAGTDKPWSISGTLRGFYDSNVNTQPDHSGAHVSSFGLEASPSIHAALSSGPTTFTASYTYGLIYYENRASNHYDQTHDVELFMNHSFSERYSLDVEESFIDAQEPEVLSPLGGSVQRANGDNFRNVAGFHFTDQVTQLLGLVFGYSNTWYDYTGSLPAGNPGPAYSSTLNRLEHLVILNARWQVQEETTVVLGYNFGATGYTSSSSINEIGRPYVSPARKNDYSHYIYLGLDHAFRSDLSFSGRAGIQIVDYYNDSTTQVSPYASLSLNYNYMDGGVLSLGFTHAKNATDVGVDINNPNGPLTTDQESSTVSLSVIQTLTPLSPDLTANLNASYQNSVYNQGVFNNQADDFYILGVSFSYQFTHYISGEIGYNYDLLESKILGRGYNRDRVYVGVTATY